MTDAPILSVRGLVAEFGPTGSPIRALHGLDFDLGRGRILGVVGESGSGKSLTAKSVLRMVPPPGRLTAGEVLFQGRDLRALDDEAMRRVRGKGIAMVFQDPQAALNPVKTVGWQIEEALTVHGASRTIARQRALELLRLVGIPEPERRIDEYPHQFSGGMRQRVVIAIALANEAPLIIADEPTTALDVTIQAQVLRLLAELRERLGVSILLITHDMGVVAEMCDDVMVMYGGRIVESGTVAQVFADPSHPYTRDLLRSMPRVMGVRQARLPSIPGTTPDLSRLPPGCAFHPRCALAEPVCKTTVPQLLTKDGRRVACHLAARGRLPAAQPVPDVPAAEPVAGVAPVVELRDLVVEFGGKGGWFDRQTPVRAVDGVSLTLRPAETLGLVGESGCGKTSVSRAMVGINPITAGRLLIDGTDVTAFDAAGAARVRATLQYVFQDPYASLNPRLTIRAILFEALERRNVPAAGREAEARRLLDLVGLDPAALDRFPRAFSGGQRQRIGIARALAVEPRALICDEPVSALDVSVQAQVINVLADLRDRLGLAILFIAHDLAVVRHLSDRLAVMYLGRIVEEGPAEALYACPRHPYTAVLLASSPHPVPDPGAMAAKPVLKGDMPSPRNPPSGCRFRTRCPIGPLVNPQRRRCIDEDPALTGIGHSVACHYPDETAALMPRVIETTQ